MILYTTRTAPALKRGYIEARYNKGFRITADEVRSLRERVHDLAVRVHQACADKLASFCGPDQVGPLPDVPSLTDTGDLPAAPSPEDPAAFQSWQEALMALSYERGKEAAKQEGVTEAFDRGKQAGIAEGQIQALWAILAARGIPVDTEARARIEACQDPEVVARWIARAMTAVSTAELFASDPA